MPCSLDWFLAQTNKHSTKQWKDFLKGWPIKLALGRALLATTKLWNSPISTSSSTPEKLTNTTTSSGLLHDHAQNNQMPQHARNANQEGPGSSPLQHLQKPSLSSVLPVWCMQLRSGWEMLEVWEANSQMPERAPLENYSWKPNTWQEMPNMLDGIEGQ